MFVITLCHKHATQLGLFSLFGIIYLPERDRVLTCWLSVTTDEIENIRTCLFGGLYEF